MTRDVPRSLIYALLGVSAALLLLLALGLVLPIPADIEAVTHPDADSMLRSGSGAPGGTLVVAAGFATGLLVLAMIGLCLLVGVAPGANGLKRWILGGTVAYGLVFSALMLSYLDFLEGGPLRIFVGFPAPTAWMMYGVWFFPWVFIVAYVVTFRTSYFTPEAEERFRELLRNKDER